MKFKKLNIVIGLIVIVLVVISCIFMFSQNDLNFINEEKLTYYAASANTEVILYDLNFNETNKITRGTEIIISSNSELINNEYFLVNYENKDYYIKNSNLTLDSSLVVLEKTLYVRTAATIYESYDSLKIAGFAPKNAILEIIGYTDILNDGTVLMYKIKYGEVTGYIYSSYLENDADMAAKHYDEEGSYQTHLARTDWLLAGSGGDLDYYPREKVSFESNVMPEYVKSYYIPSTVLYNLDAYIEQAKKTGINTFVVDIKDSGVPAYPANAFLEYSPTNYDKAINSYESYKSAIQKLKDNGFYVVGRISVFKDSYYAKDHPENTIIDLKTNAPLYYNASNWPSAFNRDVWEFNVALAVESVVEIGFNEIQFDYVRFPDGTISKEKRGELDFQNEYDEEKAQAIQRFLMYAADELHKVEAYVSADVFGEAAHTYVTAYGQYWPAISNVVDVISAMPYPDHFGTYEYGFDKPVWTIPYELLSVWGDMAYDRQEETTSPAIVRTWIQAYDTYKTPKVTYNTAMIEQQLDALYESGLTGGYMPWHSSGSLSRYTSISEALGKDYQ